jgi:hypothetical protein
VKYERAGAGVRTFKCSEWSKIATYAAYLAQY